MVRVVMDVHFDVRMNRKERQDGRHPAAESSPPGAEGELFEGTRPRRRRVSHDLDRD